MHKLETILPLLEKLGFPNKPSEFPESLRHQCKELIENLVYLHSSSIAREWDIPRVRYLLQRLEKIKERKALGVSQLAPLTAGEVQEILFADTKRDAEEWKHLHLLMERADRELTFFSRTPHVNIKWEGQDVTHLLLIVQAYIVILAEQLAERARKRKKARPMHPPPPEQKREQPALVKKPHPPHTSKLVPKGRNIPSAPKQPQKSEQKRSLEQRLEQIEQQAVAVQREYLQLKFTKGSGVGDAATKRISLMNELSSLQREQHSIEQALKDLEKK